MGIAERIRAFLDAGNVPAVMTHRLAVVVEENGGARALVRCDPPDDQTAMQLLGQEIAPALESAGFRVSRQGRFTSRTRRTPVLLVSCPAVP